MFLKRTKILKSICVLLFCILGIRLAYIGIISGKALETLAHNQQQREINVENLRGNISDKKGKSFTGDTKENLFLNKDGELLKHETESSVFEFKKEKRAPILAQHLIGYTSPDGEGKSGLEKYYDDVLKSEGSLKLSFISDASGRPAGGFKLLKNEDEKASQIKLSLDYSLQAAAEEVMDKYIKKGALVLLDVKSFDVLAMVSRPGFDSGNIYAYELSPNGELLNRAILPYNAGSVFKIVTAAAALEKTNDYLQRYFDCRGSFDLGDGHVFDCNKKDGHGILYFTDAFAKSCNCSFYLTALEAEAKNIINIAKKFGMGQKLLNVDLGETLGNLPQRSIYSNAETLNISIGQGEILISPVQCAVMAATVANGGVRKGVNIVLGIKRDLGYENLKINEETQVIEKQTANILADMMRSCVTDGTAKKASESQISIAGKTGSAQSGWIDGGTALVHGWFCGFFPFENPKYAMAILSEGGISGAGSCVEPFVELAEKICG